VRGPGKGETTKAQERWGRPSGSAQGVERGAHDEMSYPQVRDPVTRPAGKATTKKEHGKTTEQESEKTTRTKGWVDGRHHLSRCPRRGGRHAG